VNHCVQGPRDCQFLVNYELRLPEGKEWPARKADNLTVICELITYTKCGSLDVSQPCGPSRPVTGTALPFL
jgi:hypothetical protein